MLIEQLTWRFLIFPFPFIFPRHSFAGALEKTTGTVYGTYKATLLLFSPMLFCLAAHDGGFDLREPRRPGALTLLSNSSLLSDDEKVSSSPRYLMPVPFLPPFVREERPGVLPAAPAVRLPETAAVVVSTGIDMVIGSAGLRVTPARVIAEPLVLGFLPPPLARSARR